MILNLENSLLTGSIRPMDYVRNINIEKKFMLGKEG